MRILLDLGIGIGAILAFLFLLMQFTGLVTQLMLTVAGAGLAILFVIAVIYVFWPSGSSGSTDNDGGLFSDPQRYDDALSVAKRINQKTDDPEAEGIVTDMSVMDSDRKRILDKKTQDWQPHWSILTRMRHSTETVRIVYNVEEDRIVQWKSNPSPYEREQLFANFDPDDLQRVMSRSYGDGHGDVDGEPREMEARPVELQLRHPQKSGKRQDNGRQRDSGR